MNGTSQTARETTRFLLDTGAILGGLNLPPGRCWTTPGVMAEVRPGGATGRRAAQFAAAGLHVEDPREASVARVRQAADEAGTAGRLSATDVGILALALDVDGLLVTDDYTVQEMADRLGRPWRAATTTGIRETGSWSARCAGCGRTYPAARAGSECQVCGAEVRLKRRPGKRQETR